MGRLQNRMQGKAIKEHRQHMIVNQQLRSHRLVGDQPSRADFRASPGSGLWHECVCDLVYRSRKVSATAGKACNRERVSDLTETKEIVVAPVALTTIAYAIAPGCRCDAGF